MSGRTVRRFVDDLLRGQRTQRARPDDFEAQEMKTAIELRAARTGSDSPREEFVTDLHRRLAASMGETPQAAHVVGAIGHTTAGRHRHRPRGGIGCHRDRGRPQPAHSDPESDSVPGRAAHPGCTRTQCGYLAGGGRQRRRPEGRSPLVRPRLCQWVRPPCRRPTGGGLRHLHPSGLQALAGCAGQSAALPVPLDVVLAGG